MRSNSNKPETLHGKRGKKDKLSVRFTDAHYIAAVSKNTPQAVVRIVSQARGYRAKKLMQYIARTDDKEKEAVEFEDSHGVAYEGNEAIDKKYDQWKEYFERAKPGRKNPPRHVTHMLLSASCDNNDQNARRVLAAAREVLQEHLAAQGYDYILVMHRDTKHPHIHVAINNYNMQQTKKKIRLNPPELFSLRTDFANKLQELGIEQSATLRRDRPHTLDRVRRGMEKLQEQGEWYKTRIKTASPSVDALAHRQAVSKEVVRLKKEIKDATLPLTKERKEYMAALRKLSQALVTPGADVHKEILATVRKLEKEHGQMRAFSNDLANSAKNAPTLSYQQQLQRRRVVEKLTQMAIENIATARQEIQKSDIPAAQKTELLHKLRSLERGFSKGMRLEM